MAGLYGERRYRKPIRKARFITFIGTLKKTCATPASHTSPDENQRFVRSASISLIASFNILNLN